MKKIFTLITLLAAALGYANAQTTYPVSEMNGLSTTAGDFTTTFDTYSLALAKASGSSSPVYYSSSDDIRTYAKNTLTLSTTGDSFNTVVFNISSNGLRRLPDVAASTGSVTVDATAQTATWTGDATTEVTFTVGDKATYGTDGSTKAGQLCFSSLTITTGTGSGTETVVKPSFSIAAGTYYVPQTISLTCGTTDAVIYYTLDGTDPTAASTAYTEAFTQSETTTDKAIAIKGDLSSDVAEATYTFETATTVANIAAYELVDDNTVVQFANPVTIVANSGSRMFVKDDSGYALFYGTVGFTYNHGDVVPAGFVGTKTTYNEEPELTISSTCGFAAASENLPFDPEVITTSDVTAANFGHYVRINSVVLSYNNRTITDTDGNTAYVSTGLGGYGSSTDTTKVYDVIAVIGTAKINSVVVYTLYPISLTISGADELQQVANIEALYGLESGFKGQINSDIQAIYQNGNYLYVKNENTYALVYGTLSNTFENGDVITGAIASWTTYNGAKQLTPVDSTFTVARKGDAVQPEEIPLEEVGTDIIHTYLIVKGATVAAGDADKYFTVGDETLSGVTMYNRFGITVPEELEGKTFDVTGFVGIYSDTLQIYPIAITEQETGLTGDVNEDGDVDITDANEAINIIIQNGYKASADVNGDGNVDITDANAIINIILHIGQ